MVERQTPEGEVGGFEIYLRHVVFLSKTLPESTGNIQEAVAPSRHD